MKYVKISAMWCPYCIVMNKIWKKVKEENSDLVFEELDLDMDEESNNYEDLEVLPVIIKVIDGKEVKRITGNKTYEEVSEFIKGM